MKRTTILLAAMCMAPLTSGCGTVSEVMSDACVQANAGVAAIGAYVDDAKYQIERARKVANALPSEVRDDALKAVDGADRALAAVTSAATEISERCSRDYDLAMLFKDFALAWDGVKKLLDTFGGPEVGGIIDPAAYELGKKAR